MTNRDILHALVDCLPEYKFDAARRVLEDLQARHDPVLHAFLDAPEDDEPLTADEVAAIEEAKAEIAKGEGMSWEEVEAQLFGGC